MKSKNKLICTAPFCKGELAVVLLGKGLCLKHWNLHCAEAAT